MENLKERCVSLKEKKDYCSLISLLTLAPRSWTIPNTADFFSVSECLVRRARILKNEKGVMAIPNKNKGRPLSEDELQIVSSFYKSDEYSRMQLGMKDTVSVRQPGITKKVKFQKRLLLLNIDELYSQYKEYCVNTLSMKACGRTKFFMLRPEHVVEVESGGNHNVCVCEITKM
jgi:hypothetical protein